MDASFALLRGIALMVLIAWTRHFEHAFSQEFRTRSAKAKITAGQPGWRRIRPSEHAG